jgi:hypothetical protein
VEKKMVEKRMNERKMGLMFSFPFSLIFCSIIHNDNRASEAMNHNGYEPLRPDTDHITLLRYGHADIIARRAG